MRWKNARSFLVVLVVLGAFITGAVRPQPARAGTNLGIVIGASIGVFLVVIGVGTWIVYGRKYEPKRSFLPDDRLADATRRDEQGIKLAPHCRTADGQMPLACW